MCPLNLLVLYSQFWRSYTTFCLYLLPLVHSAGHSHLISPMLSTHSNKFFISTGWKLSSCYLIFQQSLFETTSSKVSLPPAPHPLLLTASSWCKLLDLPFLTSECWCPSVLPSLPVIWTNLKCQIPWICWWCPYFLSSKNFL